MILDMPIPDLRPKSILMELGLTIIKYSMISLIVVLVLVCIYSIVMNQYWLNILNWKCDPRKFLSIMNRQLSRVEKRGRTNPNIRINIAAAKMCLGEYEDAKQILLNINLSQTPVLSADQFAYTYNVILCEYETGDIEHAEELYQTNMVRVGPVNKHQRLLAEILIGERYFYLKEYKKSYECFQKLITFDLDKRQHLSIIYRLALMDVMNGEIELAKKRFRKVVKLGNTLNMVAVAKAQLQELGDESEDEIQK